MTKKILLFLILLSALPIVRLKADIYTDANGITWHYTVNGGNATILQATNSDGTQVSGVLNIPSKVGTAPGYDVTTIGTSVFNDNTSITTLTVPASVTTIGAYAFAGCTGLTGKLELPNVITIGNAAFNGCSGLTGKLELPNVTTIGIGAFNACSGLTGLELPNVITIGVSAFNGCSGLTGKLELPNVTTIDTGVFNQCIGLTGLELPNVTNIGQQAFQNCSGLTGKLELPNVTTIGNNAFNHCTGLTGLELPNVTTIGNLAFSGCTGLVGKLELPNVTSIGQAAFSFCSVTSLDLPNVMTIGHTAFVYCPLTGKLELPNVTTIGNNAFQNCTGLTGLELPKITTIEERAFESCTGLIGKIELPKTLTSIGRRIFAFCRNLTAVTFENGTNFTSITGTSHFTSCYNLQYIDMSGVTFPSTFTTISRDNSLFSGTMPYTMVYLPSSAPAAETGQENFVIGNTCDKFVVYESNGYYKGGQVGCDYSILYNFTASTAEYKYRGLSGNCSTTCFPYAATLPIRMRAYKLVKKTGGGTRFRFESVGDGDGTFQLEAYTPYLLRVTSGVYLNDNFASNNVPIAVTPATMEVALPDGQTFFGGTTTNIDNATAASRNLYNLSNNTWYPIKTSQPTGFVHSFRAYIRTTGGTPAKGFAMVIDDDENATTDIDNAAELTEDELKSGKHTFYTLDGRRAGTNYDTLKSGEMYVVKGQKFYKF